MSKSVNRVTLIGNVGQAPDCRSTPTGTKVVKFSLATSRARADEGGKKQERTEWHRVTLFGKLADIVEQYVSKGDRLYIEGRLEYSQTTDDQGGTKYWTDIVAQELVMLGSSGGLRERGDGTVQRGTDG